MTSDEVSAMILAMSAEKRDHLQHLFVHLVQVVADDKLSGFLFHTLPSPDDSDIEGVLMHTIGCGMEEVEEMMCNFIAARTAAMAAATNTDPTRTH
jgi:hypothetical protein